MWPGSPTILAIFCEIPLVDGILSGLSRSMRCGVCIICGAMLLTTVLNHLRLTHTVYITINLMDMKAITTMSNVHRTKCMMYLVTGVRHEFRNTSVDSVLP